MKKIEDVDLVIAAVRPLIVQAPVVGFVTDFAVRLFQHRTCLSGRILGEDRFDAAAFVEVALEPFEDHRHVGLVFIDQKLIEIPAVQPSAERARCLCVDRSRFRSKKRSLRRGCGAAL